MNEHRPAITAAAVLAALSAVIDPCSKTNGCWVNLVDLGMVDSVDIDDGTGQVTVYLVLDDPVCLYLFDIRSEIKSRVEALPGVTAVETKVRGDKVWFPDRATDAVQRRLGADKREVMLELGYKRPHAISTDGSGLSALPTTRNSLR
jgi:metal-sulfur cluster biosynthetic enzyme